MPYQLSSLAEEDLSEIGPTSPRMPVIQAYTRRTKRVSIASGGCPGFVEQVQARAHRYASLSWWSSALPFGGWVPCTRYLVGQPGYALLARAGARRPRATMDGPAARAIGRQRRRSPRRDEGALLLWTSLVSAGEPEELLYRWVDVVTAGSVPLGNRSPAKARALGGERTRLEDEHVG